MIRYQHHALHFLVELKSGYAIHLVRNREDRRIGIIPGQFFDGQVQIMTTNCLRQQRYFKIGKFK